MKRTFGAIGAFLLGAGLLIDCSSASIPAGQMGELNGGDGGGACGAATCASGQLCCSNPDDCSPTCMAVSQCPVHRHPCAGACTQNDCAGLPMDQIAKLCPDGSTVTANVCAKQSDGTCNWDFPACPDAGAAEAGSADASPACCPANWNLYSCTYPDGKGGLACHNPAMGCASSSICGQGCDAVVTGRCGSPSLKWYTTCGYPVCPVDVDAGSTDAGSACPEVGSPCTTQGDSCGTPSAANCGVTLVCSDHDPKGGPGGCPISTRRYKHGIDYLEQADLERLHEETLGIKLATYQYNPEVANPDATHLGFIIEDQPQSPAVDSTHHRVDLYGYVSMVVATLQVQEREIAELRKELEQTRRAATSCRASRQ